MGLYRDFMTSFTGAMKFGRTDDHTLLAEDGTMRAKGDATCWDDLVGSLVARRLESVQGTLQYNYEESTITMQTNGEITDSRDRLIFNYQIPHVFKKNSSMNLHVHWEQIDATDREFTVQYRIQKNGEAKTTSWTEVVIASDATTNAFTYTSGTLNQITRLVDVDLTGCKISDTVQFRFARTDSVSGDIDATFVDAHVERDGLGSDEELKKNEI